MANAGTIKISSVDEAADPSNRPHPGCAFRLDLYGFRAGLLDVTISTHPPTGRQVLITDTITITEDARGNTFQHGEVYDVADLLPASDEERWHLRVEVARAEKPGNGAKTKMLWLECPSDDAATRAGAADTTATAVDADVATPDGAVLGTTATGPRADVAVAAPGADDLATTGGDTVRSLIWIALAMLGLGLAITLLSRPRLHRR